MAFVLFSLLLGCSEKNAPEVLPRDQTSETAGVEVDPVARVAFGSCVHQDKPQPIWDAVIDSSPDVFLMLGDAVYADTIDPAVLRRSFEELAATDHWRRLHTECSIMMTWDDHDYGLNDGGAEHPNRAGAQAALMDLLDEPPDSDRRKQQGVYTAKVFGPPGRRVQIILLDTRYHRTPLKNVSAAGYSTVLPTSNPQATVLGDAQWRWLEKQLQVAAELRLIASSIQVINDAHPFESWAKVGRERGRLFEVLRDSGQPNIVLLSGDQHMAEISLLEHEIGYPLYDFTSSGLNNARGWEGFPNPHRVGEAYFENHFAIVDIDWTHGHPALTFRVMDEQGSEVFTHAVPSGRLQKTRE